ncbi:MAG: DUF1080 domain-containing protein [Candidatus Omnitrophota bacterium]|jgi:hypothetical protein|nr:MAG: DUF1080 domain-containing protein [Candidatus Omnitrophota bacterium]
MLRVSSLFLLPVIFAVGLAQAAEPNIPVYGNWQGEFTSPEWQNRTIRAQIVGESWDSYRAVLYVGAKEGEEQRVEVKGKTQKNVTHFEGQVDLGADLGGVFTVSGHVTKGDFKGALKGEGGYGIFELKRVELKSPTLGMKPPEGAIVLLNDSSELSREQKRDIFHTNFHISPRWDVMEDGSIQMVGSSVITKQEFGDAQIHIEFRTPYMPNERGQARGNSGVYVQGRYEIQVLDSFADKPADNLCGGIYQIATPLVEACLPPLEWQTYDITFYTPRFDADGKKIKNAEITIVHNGKTIHDTLSLPRATPGGVSTREALTGPFLLQDHGDYPRFRNFWVKPLN